MNKLDKVEIEFNIDDFWKYVDRKKESECWNWKGGKCKQGYGKFKMKKNYRAHRFIYEFTFGLIPKGIFVCHHCDNPSCVNPKHLFLGTHQDNMNDMVSKERALPGTKKLKLTLQNVDEIRIKYDTGNVKQKELAKEYGVSSSHISNIVNGRKRKFDKTRYVKDDIGFKD